MNKIKTFDAFHVLSAPPSFRNLTQNQNPRTPPSLPPPVNDVTFGEMFNGTWKNSVLTPYVKALGHEKISTCPLHMDCGTKKNYFLNS